MTSFTLPWACACTNSFAHLQEFVTYLLADGVFVSEDNTAVRAELAAKTQLARLSCSHSAPPPASCLCGEKKTYSSAQTVLSHAGMSKTAAATMRM